MVEIKSLRRRTIIAVIFVSLLLACGTSLTLAQTYERELVIEVRDAGGRPLRDACVTVVPRVGEITFRKADKRGRVRIKEIAPGNYRVVVKVDGYTAQKREVAIGEGDTTLAFSLQPRPVGEERP